MAMQLPIGGEGHDTQDEDAGIFAEVNITPLTDIVFVLLIIFMVSSSAMLDAAREGRLEIELPEAGSGAVTGDEPDLLVVAVLKDGRVAIDDEVISEDQVLSTLRERLSKTPKAMALIDADLSVEHKHVVRILDLVRQAGFGNVGIGVEQGE